MGLGTVVVVGVDCRDSKGQAPHAWPSHWQPTLPVWAWVLGRSRVPVDNSWLECLVPVLKVEGG